MQIYNDYDLDKIIGQEVWVYCSDWANRVILPCPTVLSKHSGTYYFTFMKKNGGSGKRVPKRFRNSSKYESLTIFDNEIECKNSFYLTCQSRIDYFNDLMNKI